MIEKVACPYSNAMLVLRAKCSDYSGSILLHNANVCGFHWLQVHVETECVKTSAGCFGAFFNIFTLYMIFDNANVRD